MTGTPTYFHNFGFHLGKVYTQFSQPLEIEITNTELKKYELKMNEHLRDKIILGVTSFNYSDFQTTHKGRNVVNDVLHKNIFITFSSQNATEPVKSMPLEMLRMVHNENTYHKMYLPFPNFSSSYIEINVPPELKKNPPDDPAATPGTMEYAVACKESVYLYIAYANPVKNVNYAQERCYIPIQDQCIRI